MSLIVIVPTRSRPGQCERLIKSFDETTDNADLVFILDEDDKDTYKDVDWKGHATATLDPRGSLVDKLNQTAKNVADQYDQIAWFADDNVFVTEHWDTKLLEVLKEMGGSGWVYPNDLRRADVPETWLVSTDVVKELGWFANPVLKHYYIDNSIAEVAKRASLIRWVPDVVVQHKHYSVDKTTAYDDLYRETELLFGQQDAINFNAWKASNQVAVAVSRLRRNFNPDVKWVLERV